MMTTGTRGGVLGVVLALGVVSPMFACESSDSANGEATDIDGGGSIVDASASKADAEANVADADAGADDDFVVPDASVVCDAGPCAVAITGSGDSFCVLLQDGRVGCWGSNSWGQLGYEVEAASFSATPRVLSDLTDVTSLSLGDSNACARVESGDVFCWGAPDLVNAGIVPSDGGGSSYDLVTHPTRVDAVPPATSVAVGSGFACITASDGSLSCWGTNSFLELGRGQTDNPVEPPAKALLGAQTIATVVPGVHRTFAITPSGDLLSWGGSTQNGSTSSGTGTQYAGHVYLLGRETSEDPAGVPAPVPRLSRVRGLATSSVFSCAVAGRDVKCWGANDRGQLGRGTFDSVDYLPDISNLRFVTDAEKTDAAPKGDVPLQVAVSDEHSCAVMASGRVYCWGGNGPFGALGSRVKEDVTGTPTRIDGLSEPAVGIASGASSICALLRSGSVECWGANSQGQLGIGTTDGLPHSAPLRVILPN